MDKPYIFAHRGAMGYEIENTMAAFKKAVDMGAGIESDVHLTKDNTLICLHDSIIRIDTNCYDIKELTLEALKHLKFNDGRVVPSVNEVFDELKGDCKNLRYSFDIGDENAGMALINLAKKYNILDKIEITDMRISVLSQLREYNKEVKLVYTLPLDIIEINPNDFCFEEIKNNNINVINVKADKYRMRKNLSIIVDHGLSCYCWGVNYKSQMKKILKWKYKDRFVEAIYTNYPDVLICLRDKLFCKL